MKRYVLAPAVTVALLLSATACGDDSKAGGSSKTITIAFPVPLTSGNKAVAEEMVNSARLAVKSINAAGGSGGKQLELKVYDDKLSADESAKIAQRAITVDKASVILGGYTSIEGLAIREITERRKVIYINPSTISPQLTQGATYTFRVAHDQTDYAPQMAELFAKLGVKKPVVLHDTGPTGSTMSPAIVSALKAKTLDVGEAVPFTLNSTDVSSAVTAAVAQKPDSVISIGSSAADAGLVIKTLVERGLKVPVLGFGSLVAPDALKIGGPAYDSLPGVYTLTNKQPSKPQHKDFIAKYVAEYGGDPAQLELKLAEQTAATWDAMHVLDLALDATNGDTDGDALAKALKALPPYEGAAGKAGATISFAESNTGFKNALVAFKVEKGIPAEAKF